MQEKYQPNSEGRKVCPEGFMTSSLTFLDAEKACVAIRITADGAEIRDTKDDGDATLKFNHAEWAAFIGGVKKGEFDVL